MRRGTILLAAGGATLGGLMLVLSPSVVGVLSGRFLVEMFGAGVAPAAMALLSERGGAAHRGRRISIFTTSQSIGLLSGSLLGGFLSSNLPSQGAFGVVTALSAITVVAGLLVPARDSVPGTRKRDWRAVVRKVLPSFGVVVGNDKLMRHGLLHAYGGVVLRKAGIVGVFGLFVVYLQETLAFEASTSGGLSALNPASQALSMPLWGRGADVFGRRPIFLVGHLLTVLVPLMILLADSVWLVAAAFLVLGIGFAAFITGMTTYIGDVAPPDQQGELMGLLKVSQGLGGVIGPLVAGIVSSPSLMGYDGMFIIMSLMILIGLGLSLVGTKGSGSPA